MKSLSEMTKQELIEQVIKSNTSEIKTLKFCKKLLNRHILISVLLHMGFLLSGIIWGMLIGGMLK